jgi:hypothetical protein
MRRFTKTVVFFAITAVLLAVAFPAQAASNKWRLQFSGNAESNGTIVMHITPKGGEMIETRTEINKGRSENGVAKDVTESLHAQLPHGHFHVERDDGEDVLIKRKHHDDARFDVKVVSNTVKGVRINPDHE